MSDRQCSSCGGFCGRGGCKRENVKSEQEPVAWMCADEDMTRKGYSRFSRNCEGEWNIPVYTAPQARKPLTEQQILELLPDAQHGWTTATYGKWVARAIERAHGITE